MIGIFNTFLKSIILILGILIASAAALVFLTVGPIEIPWIQERYKAEVSRVVGDVMIQPAIAGLDDKIELVKSDAPVIRINQTDIADFLSERISDGKLARLATLEVELRRGFMVVDGRLSAFGQIPFSILLVPTVKDGFVDVEVQSIDIGIVALNNSDNQFIENIRSEIESIVSTYLKSNGLTIEAIDVQNGYLLLTVNGI